MCIVFKILMVAVVLCSLLLNDQRMRIASGVARIGDIYAAKYSVHTSAPQCISNAAFQMLDRIAGLVERSGLLAWSMAMT